MAAATSGNSGLAKEPRNEVSGKPSSNSHVDIDSVYSPPFSDHFNVTKPIVPLSPPQQETTGSGVRHSQQGSGLVGVASISSIGNGTSSNTHSHRPNNIAGVLLDSHSLSITAGGSGNFSTALSPTRAARYPYWNSQPRYNLLNPTWGNASSPSIQSLAGANNSPTPTQSALLSNRENSFMSMSHLSLATNLNGAALSAHLKEPAQLPLVPPDDRAPPPVMVGDCILECSLLNTETSLWGDVYSSSALETSFAMDEEEGSGFSSDSSAHDNPLFCQDATHTDGNTNNNNNNSSNTGKTKVNPMHLNIPVFGGSSLETPDPLRQTARPNHERGVLEDPEKSKSSENLSIDSAQLNIKKSGEASFVEKLVDSPVILQRLLPDGSVELVRSTVDSNLCAHRTPPSAIASFSRTVAHEIPLCPLEELEDLVEVARLFATDVENVHHAIPANLYSLQAKSIDVFAIILQFVQKLFPILLSSAAGGIVDNMTSTKWYQLRRQCESLASSTFSKMVDDVVDTAQVDQRRVRQKQHIATWVVVVLENCITDFQTMLASSSSSKGMPANTQQQHKIERPKSGLLSPDAGSEVSSLSTANALNWTAAELGQWLRNDAAFREELTTHRSVVEQYRIHALRMMLLRGALSASVSETGQVFTQDYMPLVPIEKALEKAVKDLLRKEQGNFCVQDFPSHKEITSRISSIANSDSWSAWFQLELLMRITSASREAMHSFTQSFMGGAAGKSLVRTLQAHSDEAAKLLSEETATVAQLEARYARITQRCLKYALRRLVTSEAEKEILGRECPRPAELLLQRLHSHNDSVRLALNELYSLRVAVQHDIRQFTAFANAWGSNSQRVYDSPKNEADEKERYAEEFAVPSLQKQLLQLSRRCQITTCTHCRTTAGRYMTTAHHLTVIRAALDSIASAATLLQQLIASARHHKGSSSSLLMQQQQQHHSLGESDETKHFLTARPSTRALNRLRSSLRDLTVCLERNIAALHASV